MFENTKKKSGWFEEPSVRNEKGKFVAKDHSEALTRAKYAKDKPACVPVCLAPCGHKKEDIVDVNEIIDDVQDKKKEMAKMLDKDKISDKDESESDEQIDKNDADD